MRALALNSLIVAALCAVGSAWAQVKQDPKLFFETAQTSFTLKDREQLKPKAGTALKPLTAVQSVRDLREFQLLSDKPLVLPGGDKAGADKLQRVLRDPLLQNIQLVSFDLKTVEAAAYSDTKLRLCDGNEPYCGSLRTTAWEKVGMGAERAFANLGRGNDEKPRGQAIFIRDDSGVYGTFNVGGAVYLMRPLSGGVFAVTSSKRGGIDRYKDDVLDLERSKANTLPYKPADPSNPGTDTCPNPEKTHTLEVITMATAKAKEEALKAGHDLRQLVQTAANSADMSFRNSNINGQLRVAGMGATKYIESGNFATDVHELLKEGGKLQDVREARRKAKADVAVLIVHDADPLNCGRVAEIGVQKDKAYAVVNWQCITDKFSLIHEIGHLAGAWHDPQTVSGFKVEPPYAHGYVTTGKEPVATIMAYRDKCGTQCGRVWYWSNPYTKYIDGQILGTPDKSFDACVWRQRLPVMSTFDGG
jgi:hypothetical protein